MNQLVVCAFYKFVMLEDYRVLRAPLLGQMQDAEVLGTILLAREGINGTISGNRSGVDKVLRWLKADERLTDLRHKESISLEAPFHRTKVKIKDEIVTLGIEDIDPTTSAGTYVDPVNWNELISDPDVLLVDTRNDYEVGVGTFKNAISPGISTFREFPGFVERSLGHNKHQKIAMFCTGGIRCEKSTAYLKQKGFDEVYHLKGGILNYLEKIPPGDSLWEGECFVFDDRVTVNHDLDQGQYEQCRACRRPLSAYDKISPDYRPGISCAQCAHELSKEQVSRFSEREKQVKLAKIRGETHIGASARQAAVVRKTEKAELKRRQRALNHLSERTVE